MPPLTMRFFVDLFLPSFPLFFPLFPSFIIKSMQVFNVPTQLIQVSLKCTIILIAEALLGSVFR